MYFPMIKLKTAVIDVGSNSVRLKIFSDGNILFRDLISCRLSEGIENGKLAYKSINRTFEALDKLMDKAKSEGAKTYAFATAAVRNTTSKEYFKSEFYKRYSIELDVLSGEKEAEIGLDGALGAKDGGVVDIGGASTEVAVKKGGKIIYSYSLPQGAVVLTDAFGKNRAGADEFLKQQFKKYGDVPAIENKVCIGGTATSLAYIKSGLKNYDPSVVDSTVLTREYVEKLTAYFYGTDFETISEQTGLSPSRARVIHSGAEILLHAFDLLKTDEITVSEADNLEGYYYGILMENKDD